MVHLNKDTSVWKIIYRLFYNGLICENQKIYYKDPGGGSFIYKISIPIIIDEDIVFFMLPKFF